MEQWMVVFAGCAGVAAIAQAIFAFFLLRVTGKQKDISREQVKVAEMQAEIMEAQTQLSEDIHDSTKLPDIKRNYDNRPIRVFWDSLNGLYNIYRENSRVEPGADSIESLIQRAGFPTGLDPSTARNLRDFTRKHEVDWGLHELWKFVKAIYSRQDDQHVVDLRAGQGGKIRSEINEDRVRLTLFWETALVELRDPHRWLQPDPNELVMLTWLALAVERGSSEPDRVGQKELFEFAKTEWDRRSS